MELNEYQEKAGRTDGNQPWEYYFVGLSGEAGETLDAVKKMVYHGERLDAEHLGNELGDALWYIARAANRLGFTLEDIARMNIEKLTKRHPDRYVHTPRSQR